MFMIVFLPTVIGGVVCVIKYSVEQKKITNEENE